jgi:uncharacterized protein DUF1592/uncharacterized protein DUF1588/uncharacterized protein DUF1585/uncharacterized protein DUF1587/uncharacterized protein DUF1595
MIRASWMVVGVAAVLLLPLAAARADDAVLAALEQGYTADVRPLVAKFCGDCHSKDLAEAEIDLVAMQSLTDVRQHAPTWQKVAEMLASGQMPPKDAGQPTDDERARLRGWVHKFLKEEARRRAGDPGPVILRRLSNAQYTFVIRDLTGTPSLSPAREFPVDGAAGEGFTNTGGALVMSPALITKYLDAAKEVSGHMVLLPGGNRFSPSTTRRDWTEETLAEIRRLYAQYSDSQGGTQVNLQGIVFETNGGGRLPLDKYFAATLAEREALTSGTKSIDAVARERGLSPKYLGGLWKLLTEPSAEGQPSLLIDGIRARWQNAQPEEAGAIAADVIRWQQSLWKFNSVGHIGKVGGPKSWMEEIQPIAPRLDARLKLEPAAGAGEVTIYLTAGDAGDGREHDFVVWQQPRLVAPGRPDLLLKDVRRVTAELAAAREKLFANAARCLTASAEATQTATKVDIKTLAQKHGVEPDILAAWLTYLGIGTGESPRIEGHFTRPVEKISGYDFVQGWSTQDLPMLAANASDQHVRIPGNMFPHSVAVHPTPTVNAVVGWQSPLAGDVKIAAVVQHAHPECGNGVTWLLELRRGATRQRLAAGIAQGGKEVPVGPIEKLAVHKGDVVSLVIGPRDGNHSCDLTRIDLSLTSLADEKRAWNLAADVSSNLHAGNPHADRLGNDGVWHFYAEPVSGGGIGPVIPADSLLAKWQAATETAEKQSLAEQVQKLLVGGPAAKDTPDAALHQQLASLGGPLLSAARAAVGQPAEQKPLASGDADQWGLDPALFGRHPVDSAAGVDAASLCVQAPATIAVRLPADLVAGYELVTSGALHASGAEGSVQLQVSTAKPESAALRPGVPLIATDGTAARRRLEASIAQFRQWFPAALCYARIVPVDEVVTLTLFYREDHELARLMLSEAEAVKLDRLWDELHYISYDALTLVDAFAQLLEYASQDGDPKLFEPLRGPIEARAAAFRQRLIDTEPRHLEAVLKLAERAYRRPLLESESRALRDLYHSLRKQELPHDEAIRLTLARVLVAPAFLYRAEQAQPSAKPTPVTNNELASRLSFFLWSSLPDEELLAVAARGELQNPEVLAAQARRMMKDQRTRRLATEFACQWLHIYDFDSHDEKSPAAFPTFAELRGPMYEEAIRVFTDLVQRDGSILELVDADHTFVNEALARHYGIDGVKGAEWRRVDGVKKQGRGGILAFAATLSKQSGASRTSPILRGNWVCEVLLGEKLPKPPKGVPVLPETVPAGLTERQLIEQHSSVESCAKCHVRIDPYGFALEGYDAIGRLRAADVKTKVLDGTELDGLPGLRNYFLTKRRDDFVRQFCKKLLGYSLGRSVQLSDEPLLDEMQASLKANDYRIGVAIDAIVKSPQFRMIRGRDFDENALVGQ